LEEREREREREGEELSGMYIVKRMPTICSVHLSATNWDISAVITATHQKPVAEVPIQMF
jgi:hypothetical protein